MVYDKELKHRFLIWFIDKNNDLHIYDWKRCKEIKKDNKWETTSLECLEQYDVKLNFGIMRFNLIFTNTLLKKITKNYKIIISSLFASK